jgi:hypothetical protein
MRSVERAQAESNRWRRAPRLVYFALGFILLVAAILKGHQLWADPFAVDPVFSSRAIAVLAAHAEGVLGWWLLWGSFPGTTRAIALVCFLLFLVVSLHQGFSGKTSCGCFGQVPVRPWVMVAFDLGAVVLLAIFPPPVPSSQAPRRGLALAGLVLAVSQLTMWLLYSIDKPSQLIVDPRTVNLGVMAQADRREGVVSFTNPGSEEVHMGKVVTSCPCLRVTILEPDVRPRTTVVGKIVIDLTREPNFVGEMGATVSIFTSAGTKLAQFQVNVTVSSRY